MDSTKTILLISFLVLATGFMFIIEYGMPRPAPMEIGIVAHKTFAPAGQYHPIKSPAPQHLLVVIQPDIQQGYWIAVEREMFYDVEIGDRVPLAKQYGRISGREIHAELLTE